MKVSIKCTSEKKIKQKHHEAQSVEWPEIPLNAKWLVFTSDAQLEAIPISMVQQELYTGIPLEESPLTATETN